MIPAHVVRVRSTRNAVEGKNIMISHAEYELVCQKQIQRNKRKYEGMARRL